MELRARTTETQVTSCKECGGAVETHGRVMIGEVFDCPRCEAPLEVANLEPLALEPFARIEADPADFADFDIL